MRTFLLNNNLAALTPVVGCGVLLYARRKVLALKHEQAILITFKSVQSGVQPCHVLVATTALHKYVGCCLCS